jgi:hypothetical protein
MRLTRSTQQLNTTGIVIYRYFDCACGKKWIEHGHLSERKRATA